MVAIFPLITVYVVFLCQKGCPAFGDETARFQGNGDKSTGGGGEEKFFFLPSLPGFTNTEVPSGDEVLTASKA